MKKIGLSFFVLLSVLFLSSCVEEVMEYEVNFETNGGSTVEMITIIGDDAVEMPANPTKEGYEFDGWFWDDGEFVQSFTINSLKNAPLSDMFKVYAKWTPIEADLVLLGHDWVVFDTVKISYDSNIDLSFLPEDPQRDGYEFDGWFWDDGEFTQALTIASYKEAPKALEYTVYSHWVPLDFDLVFLDYDGQVIETNKVTYNDILDSSFLPDNPLREGYDFTGWDNPLPNVMPNETITINATYEEVIVIPNAIKVALITDSGTIDDQSYNQIVYEGVVEYCEDNDLSYKYYRPLEISDSAFLVAIEYAIEEGAEIVVVGGFLFETAIYNAQSLYPNIHFIIIDGVPHDATWQFFDISDNTLSILFNEAEAGFLAGYMTVLDGYRNLGFVGGMAVPVVQRYGVGFIAGAYYAADELGVDITFSDDNYEYLGDFSPSDRSKSLAASWYLSGIEVIFSVAGGANYSVMAAAIESNAMMISVDVDAASDSSTVLTSAIKRMDIAVYQALETHFGGTWVGGRSITLGATDNGIGLPMETARFDTVGSTIYDTVYAKIVDGTIVVPVSTEELTVFLNALTIDTSESPDGGTIRGEYN